MAEEKQKIRAVKLYEDAESFTGWSIASRVGAGLPATIWEVALWKEIVRLRGLLEQAAKDSKDLKDAKDKLERRN